MSTPIDSLIAKYNPKTSQYFENALKEIIQEITLAGLNVAIEEASKKDSAVESAFLKANTKNHFLKIHSGKKFAGKCMLSCFGNGKHASKEELSTIYFGISDKEFL